MLEEKLLEIGKTLGKVDEFGQVTEDLRGQILGQLSERLSYDRLYQDAIRDPRLVRTREELEVAIDNATTARQVVWELFQDLDSFRLDDYKQMDDGGEGINRLTKYFQAAIARAGGRCDRLGDNGFSVTLNGETPTRLTMSRETAKEDDEVWLLGLEQPLVRRFLDDHRSLDASERAWVVGRPDGFEFPGVLSVWHIQIQDASQRLIQKVVFVGIDADGNRCKPLERMVDSLAALAPSSASLLTPEKRAEYATALLPEMLRRDLAHKGLLTDSATLAWRLLAWVEVV